MLSSARNSLIILAVLMLFSCTDRKEPSEVHDALSEASTRVNALTPVEEGGAMLATSAQEVGEQQGEPEVTTALRVVVRFAGVTFTYPVDLATEVKPERLPVEGSSASQTASDDGIPQPVLFTFITGAEVQGDALSPPTLLVRAVRERNGLHYTALSDERRQQLEDVEARLQSRLNGSTGEAVEEDARLLQSINGYGIREVVLDGSKFVYRFQGITNDGRFLVELNFPGTTASPERYSPSLLQLDEMVESLLIDGQAEALNVTSCLDDAEFITSVTIPDGAEIAPGELFVKTWRMRNTGTCTWTERYSWTFKGGSVLTMVDSKPLDLVPPGEEVDISVTLVAPESPGTYAGQWQLTGAGQFEGIGPEVYYLITVPDA